VLEPDTVDCDSVHCQLTPRHCHVTVDCCRKFTVALGPEEVGVGLVNAYPHTSARRDSTPRSGDIRPHRGPLLPPSSILSFLWCILLSPPLFPRTLNPKCRSRVARSKFWTLPQGAPPSPISFYPVRFGSICCFSFG